MPRWSCVLLCLIGVLALNACGSSPTRPEAQRRPGGYYLDDGPGDNVPVNLDQLPDAEPRNEPIKPSTARPYTAFGRTYVPMAEAAPYKVRGMASWYGKRYHGQSTASGEIYDMYAMTAAHPTLPIPSYARVTNLRNGKSVVVRINDRGPFRSERVIDLSYAAAHKLGIVVSGRDMVEVEAIVASRAQGAPLEANAGEAAQLPPLEPESSGIYVQLGAFSARQNAQSFLARARAELSWLNDTIALYGRDGVYRVHAGPYLDREEADRVATRIEQATELRPVIITR